MREAEIEPFGQMMAAIYDLYGRQFSEYALSLWWNALKGYDLKAISDALSRYVVNADCGQFVPKPADVVRMIGGTTTDRALLAWEKVDKAVRQVGVYKDVVFDDPLIHRVLQDMGGWISLGGKKESEWPFVAKEFETRYRGYAYQGVTPPYLPVLTGLANWRNAQEGYGLEGAYLLGDRERARVCMAGGARDAGGFVCAGKLARESDAGGLGTERGGGCFGR